MVKVPRSSMLLLTALLIPLASAQRAIAQPMEKTEVAVFRPAVPRESQPQRQLLDGFNRGVPARRMALHGGQ